MGTQPQMKIDPNQNTPLPVTDWDRVAKNPEFEQLMAAKARFIVPATIFFILYFFALPTLVGYAPELMNKPVIGPVNVAYLFALSQFAMTWIVGFLYMRAAGRFDETAKSVLAHLTSQKKGSETK
jgi:uncharacterized membrane protein (DUF485 family)